MRHLNPKEQEMISGGFFLEALTATGVAFMTYPLLPSSFDADNKIIFSEGVFALTYVLTALSLSVYKNHRDKGSTQENNQVLVAA